MAGGMLRLSQIDVPDRMAPVLPPIASQILFASVCTLSAIVLRVITDVFLPGAGPFALTVPAVLVATLFGRWLCGALTQAVLSLYAWYFVLPMEGSFRFVDPTDGPRVAVNMAAGFFVVALGELFRRAVRRALDEREVLLLELEHRVKNNFASMASVVRLQQREATDSEAQAALQSTLGRIESYANAHALLYRGYALTGMVDMRSYLGELCEALQDSLSGAVPVRIVCEIDAIRMPRERAVTVGLLVNEVATNSAKHAFDGRNEGVIRLRFRDGADAYELELSDDGAGIQGAAPVRSLGVRLIESLTAQAAATVETATGPDGTTYRFTLSR